MNRLLPFFAVLVLLPCGCRPRHVNPPLFMFESQAELRLAASLHSVDVLGKIYTVEGMSMAPVILPFDIVVSDPREPFSAQLLGSIVVYTMPDGAAVVHRLVLFDREGGMAEGDHNRGADRYRVTADNYAGVVAGIYRMKL